MSNPNIIHVFGEGSYAEVTNGTSNVNPGDLLAITSTGVFSPHSTANNKTSPIFALEPRRGGGGVTDATGALTVYGSGEQIKVIYASSSNKVYATVAAAAPAITAGDQLVSAGDGTLAKLAGTTTQASVIAIAEESVDNSAGTTKTHILISIV